MPREKTATRRRKIEYFITLYHPGITVNELAQKTGLCTATIRKYQQEMAEAGYPLKDGRSSPVKRHTETLNRLIEAYEPGMTMTALAEKAYLTRPTISGVYKEELAERGIVFGGRGYKRKNKGKERE